MYIPLKDSRVGLFSMKTLKTESELNPRNIKDSKPLGEVMVIKPLADPRYVLVAYEGGQLALWDIKVKDILSWLPTELCPMTVDFDDFLKKGIIGSPSNIIQVTNNKFI